MPPMSFKKPFRAVPIRYGAHYAAERRRRRKRGFTTKLAAVSMLVAALGAGAFVMREHDAPAATGARPASPPESSVLSPMMSAAQLDAQQPSASVSAVQVRSARAGDGGWSYRNCRAARAAGAAPLYVGQPGYGPHMDGDGDGIACEPYRGQR